MDNQPTSTKSPAPRPVEAAARAVRQRFSLRRGAAAIVADLALALATVLILFGLFMGWQAWLASHQTRASRSLVQARQDVAAKLAAVVATRRAEVVKALALPDVGAALAANADPATRATVARRIRANVPGASAVTLYSPQLNEVLKGNLQQIGYARAAQLMQVLSRDDVGPAQSPNGKVLSFAGPVHGADGKAVAYATVDFPATLLRDVLRSTRVDGGSLELREANRAGDILLDRLGATDLAEVDDPGLPVAHSMYRVLAVPPRYWLPVTRSFPGALALAIIALALGGGLLWLRPRLRARLGGPGPVDEPVLADVLASETVQNPPPKPARPAAAAAAAATPTSDEIPDRSIFRAYDIRGIVGKTLTAGVARQLGRAIGSALRDRQLNEIVVGRDGRLSGPMLAEALIEGLRQVGVDVIDIGAVPTPVSYFAAYHLNTGSCVSVTGSHNPPDYNGFKVVLGGETLAEDQIIDLYERIVESRFSAGEGSVRQYDIVGEYIERIASDIQTGRPLKVVVDAGNGIASITGPGVVQAVGCEPIPLYCDVDGNFPNHHPDPSEPKNLSDLVLMVQKTGADLGIAFDGDGDRLGVVTRDGEIIFPDRVLMLFAQDVLTRNPGATILYDVKCTGHLQPLILKAGGSPLMWKTGHSLIKAKMKETEAQLAGEMSGHFFFRERWFGFDDGVYAAARLLEILADDPEGRAPEEIFATLPKGVATPELHVPMQEGQNHPFVDGFRERAQFEGARVTTIDGVRADWPDGWGLVRASNTTPVLVLRFDADSAAALKRIQEVFRAQLLACDPKLQLPF